jgi:small-conductance mechanosensitive channel
MRLVKPAVALAATLFLALSVAPPGARAQAANPAPAQGQSPAQNTPADAAPGAAPANGAAPAVPAPKKALPPPDPGVQAAREKMDAGRAVLDALEASLSVEGLRNSDLDELRQRLDPARRELLARSDEIGPRLAAAKSRLEELGPKPAEGAAPEDPAASADRERLQRLHAELDAALKQNRALVGRADEISERISSRRRALFTGQLFERSVSVLDPALWTGAFAGLAGEWRALNYLVSDWSGYATQRQGRLAVIGIALGALAIAALVGALGRFVRMRLRKPAPPAGERLSRLKSAREAIKVFCLEALVAPLATLAAVAFANGFDVIPPRAEELIRGLTVAIFIIALGNGIARALLAPGEAWRRLPGLSDRAAGTAFRYFSFAVWALAIAAFLNATHRALFAPVGLTVVTSAVMALLIGAFIARFLINLGKDEAETASPAEGAPAEASEATPAGTARLAWVRFIAWIVVAFLIGALVAGYVGFAAFVAARLVIAAAVLGGLYVLYSLIDAFFTEGLARGTHRSRTLSTTLGLKPESLELMGVVLAGLLKLLLFVVAAFLIAGSWGTSTADVMDTVERVTFGVRIGSTTITLWSVLSAVGLLLVGLVLARGLQRWVATAILPRTGLEPSLQSSIATILGYVGVIVAIMLSVGELGINLESIAIVAGALSVGIGFGLQSIVSNFVSGLILLAERPIRVGDTINVKGEEGYVRRISVRSTEIETFERATVIVPNTDLITGMVKNWTHSNTSGRIIVTVNVTFDADPEEVRDILVSCACDHPQVLQKPPPRVFLSKFADAGMVFELRCVVANVDYGLTVKSDLHFQLLSRFRKAGIVMASQPWAALGSAPPPPPPERDPPEA